MANGVLGLGSGQAASLNSDLIDKLKTAERKSAVAPIETKITNITKEKETFSTINTKVKALLEAIKPFDLFVSGGVNAFGQKSASTSGDSVTFDAADIKSLKKGSTTVKVSQLAQKDVYQSDAIDKSAYSKTSGTFNIKVGSDSTGVKYDFNDYNSYDELISAINTQTGVDASLEKVGVNAAGEARYRLVLKSESTGEDNKLTITDNANLGFNSIGAKDLDGNPITGATNHVLKAQNMNATVDGIAYNVSTNTITVDGLKITANKVDTTGSSTINITEDNSQIETQMNSFITKYNELVASIESEAQSSDSTLGDKSAMRGIITQIKDKLFGTYGENNNKSIFNYGIELDKYGSLSLNSTVFNKAVNEDMSSLQDLFLGTAENKGLGTKLKETLDSITFTGGTLDTYEKAMLKRETTLNEDKTKAETALDTKYQQLALQFAAYGTIINQMESSFSGLKMMINQSTSGN